MKIGLKFTFILAMAGIASALEGASLRELSGGSNERKTVRAAATAFGKVFVQVLLESVSTMLKQHVLVNKYVFGAAFAFNHEFFPAAPFAYLLPDGGIDNIDVAEIADYSTLPWYADAAASKEASWSAPYIDSDGAGSDVCMVTYSVPIMEGDYFLGVLTSDYLIKYLEDGESCP